MTPDVPDGSRRGANLMRTNVIVSALALIVIAGVGIMLWNARPRFSEEEIRDVVQSTIQREAAASFLITGYVDLTATTRVENTRTVLPGIVDLDLGTTSAVVRMPGRVSYGFDVRQIEPGMIRVLDDGFIEVEIPEPQVYSVEPNLEQFEIETQRGWARLPGSTLERVRDRALALVQPTLRRQAEQHLRDSRQPAINTAAALEHMLRPVLEAAGIENPQLRFRVGRTITIEPGRAR